MARKWQEQQRDPQMAELSFDASDSGRLPVAVAAQQAHCTATCRGQLRLPQACVEDIDCRGRELDKPCGASSAPVTSSRTQRGILVVGATSTNKTYVSCALGQAALRKGHRVRYYLPPARRTGARSRRRSYSSSCRLARFDLLILDDFLMSPPTKMQRRDLLEVLEDRYSNRSTLCSHQSASIRTPWHARLRGSNARRCAARPPGPQRLSPRAKGPQEERDQHPDPKRGAVAGNPDPSLVESPLARSRCRGSKPGHDEPE